MKRWEREIIGRKGRGCSERRRREKEREREEKKKR